jgi:hypothetical protein
MATKTIDLRPLGLSTFEKRLLMQARWAADQIKSGDYLPGLRYRKAALRLIERGFLTESDSRLSPHPADWPPIVRLTADNIATIQAAIADRTAS